MRLTHVYRRIEPFLGLVTLAALLGIALGFWIGIVATHGVWQSFYRDQCARAGIVLPSGD